VTASALYLGRVGHTRHGEVSHRFLYRSWWMLVDLDELPALDRGVRGFGWNRRAAVSFHDEDHGARDGSALRPWIEERCAQAGIDLEGGPVRVLAHPRVLGYVFNPISVWFCHGPAGDLRAVVYEVSNTWREVHSYLVPVTSDQQEPTGLWHHAFDKQLFVSPFMDMDHRYDFRVRVPDERAAVLVEQRAKDRLALTATLTADRVAFDGAGLRRAARWAPHVTALTMLRIHWQAVRLWRKGARYRRRGVPPVPDVSVEVQPIRVGAHR